MHKCSLSGGGGLAGNTPRMLLHLRRPAALLAVLLLMLAAACGSGSEKKEAKASSSKSASPSPSASPAAPTGPARTTGTPTKCVGGDVVSNAMGVQMASLGSQSGGQGVLQCNYLGADKTAAAGQDLHLRARGRSRGLRAHHLEFQDTG